MNVFVYDPFVSKDIIEKLGGKKVEDLTEAVKSMDAISLTSAHLMILKFLKYL